MASFLCCALTFAHRLTPDDKFSALLRAAQSAPPDDLARMIALALCTLDAIQSAEREASRTGQKGIGQEWARRAQVAAFFGVTPNALDKWLPDLIRRGIVRILTPPNGWTLYNLRDIERAFAPALAPTTNPPPRRKP